MFTKVDLLIYEHGVFLHVGDGVSEIVNKVLQFPP